MGRADARLETVTEHWWCPRQKTLDYPQSTVSELDSYTKHLVIDRSAVDLVLGSCSINCLIWTHHAVITL
ncbi:hypothetical protein RRG08_028352 [Elysia crispata]|uniref:Uncharacterized protein n=1 Tax=Elysia crispata TaxID=231223 RepID=A0AAE1AWF5_9GAST|nr:hypothetical protein RRG08_028352 [Elysia crispata]